MVGVYGLIMGGLAIGVVQPLRGRAFMTEPGHALLHLGTLLFVELILHSNVSPGQLSTAWLGTRGLTAAVCAWLAAPRAYWKAFFVVWSLDAFYLLLGSVASSLQLSDELVVHASFWSFAASPTVAFVALAIVSCVDLWREPRPDWLHWLGIGLLLLLELAIATAHWTYLYRSYAMFW
jgi:hypothetical protein